MVPALIRHFLAAKHSRGKQYVTLNLVELHRASALHNLELIQHQHSGLSVIPVLKGNAYGHGLIPIAEILNQAECACIAVDGYFEAAKLRFITRHRLLVLGYIRPDNIRLLDTKRCSFMVQDHQGLAAFGALNKPVRIHMELNTGFNRLGLPFHEVSGYLATLKTYPNLELEGIMTHLADADNESSDSFTEAQVRRFDAAVEQIRAAGFDPRLIHVAQTAGSVKVHSRYANAIRLGIGLYGINPLGLRDKHYADLAGLQPVLELKTTIIKTIDLRPGDRVSYGGTFTADKPLRIGVLPLGYYEGLPWELSNVGCVTSGATVLPIVGRICMNHTMISLEHTSLQVGDEVTVISANPALPNSSYRLQKDHGLSPYIAMTGLSSTMRRQIVS